MNTYNFRKQIKHVLAVKSRNVASAALAVRMVTIPFVPFTSTVVEAVDLVEEPPQAVSTLSVRQAPVQLNAEVPTVNIQIGESTTQKALREAREAEEARKRAEEEARVKAEQAQKDAVARVVVSRYAPTSRDNGGLNIEQARDLTVFYAQKYGVDPVLMSKIISCESGYNQFAKNRNSTASGYGQFIAGTWRSTIAAMGWDASTSVFEGEKNLEAMAYLMSVRGSSPWNSSRGCWANR